MTLEEARDHVAKVVGMAQSVTLQPGLSGMTWSLTIVAKVLPGEGLDALEAIAVVGRESLKGAK